MPAQLIPLITFAAILLTAFGFYSVISDAFLKDRDRFSQRIDERFRLRQRERAKKSILFKDLNQLAGEASNDPTEKQTIRQRFENMIDQSGVDVTPGRLLATAAITGALSGVIFGVFYGPILGLIAALIAFPLPIGRVHLKRRARLEKLRTQLPDAFDLMARVIRAGQTMNQAMLAVVDEFPHPISVEFNLCYEQQNLGLPPDEAYQDLARRTDLVEVKIFVMASMVQRQTGGNLAELMEKLSVMLRDRFRIQGVVKSLTAEGRMQALLLMALPPVMFFMMFALNPAYMRQSLLISLLTAFGVGGAVCLLMLLVPNRLAKLDDRLKRIGDKGGPPPPPTVDRSAVTRLARQALPKVGNALVPEDEEQRTRLQTKLYHAGFYGQQTMKVFLGVKMLIMMIPLLVGVIAGAAGLVPLMKGILGGVYIGGLGLILPGYWLSTKKKKRQIRFRRALPDALDILVICIEGGLTLAAALKRVSAGLRTVHPELSREMDIVQREIQLGRSPGEAIRNLGDRSDLEEIRSLASVVIQAERFGAGLSKSLRVHAEMLRLKRQQRAEEMAQKAATKILLPTLFFIFPAIFVVILGPAVVQISKTMLNK